MSNLHAPTVPSGPTTDTLTNGDSHKLSFAELQRKKDDMEAELKVLGSVLDSVRVDSPRSSHQFPCAAQANKTIT